LFLYSKLAIWIPFIDRNLIQMSRTHLLLSTEHSKVSCHIARTP
jgi:hypothetical protein